MRLATFNANSIRSRLGITLDWLAANKPDVLCIQETKATDPDFPLAPFKDAGWHVSFRGEKSYNGVAIVSRKAPDSVKFGFDDAGQADETRLAWAQFGSLHVINTYVPQGREITHPMYQYKIEWLTRLKKLFKKRLPANAKAAWLGDLNVAPDAMDIYNSSQQEDHVCFHVDIRKAFADAVAFGFVDVFRKHHPEPGQYSYFDYRTVNAVKRGMGWRVDHILCTRGLADQSTDAFIDLKPRLADKPSDHTFMVADFKD